MSDDSIMKDAAQYAVKQDQERLRMAREINFPDIIQIKEIDCPDKVNRHLDIGWILLGTASNQYSDNGFSLSYSIGWSKASGAIREPEKTEAEIEMEQWMAESNS